jgi:ATP-binding protein involved in chromosome partitioning
MTGVYMSTVKTETRVAFPTSDRKTVDSHFGHAKEFAFANIEGGKIVSVEYLTPPPHEPGVIPKFVSENGADVIITGGMGARAVGMFEQAEVEVILGVSGSIDAVLEAWLEGKIESTGSACEHTH